jgi:hypothetical protein
MAFENTIVAARITGIRCPGSIPGYERNTVEWEKKRGKKKKEKKRKKPIDNGVDYRTRSKCQRYVADAPRENVRC